MELIDKIKVIIDRLENIRNQSNPNVEVIREQVDFIANEELPNFDEEFDEWSNRLYDGGEPDDETDKLITKIGDLYIHANELIDTIRQQFDIEDIYDDIDDVLAQTIWDNGYDKDSEDEDEEEYEIVLNEFSKSALFAIGLDNNDDKIINLMGTILIGISSEESDDLIVGRAFAQFVMSGFMLPIEEIKEMIKETREKCQKQLFGLQIAINNLREYNCSAEEALSQIQWLL